ncbi:MAG TPA: hypothetical protein VHI54_05145 [Actinomycetota bacterium]|nr:hypothetical protein [Actinomycetota bacterium]
MSRFGLINEGRLSRRAVVAVVSVVVLMSALGGAAWALSVTKGKKIDVSATYTISVAGGEGRAQHLFSVGQVAVGTECFAALDEDESFAVGGKAGTVTNNGPDPVLLVVGHTSDFAADGTQVSVIEPGDSEAFGQVGLAATSRPGEEDSGGLMPFTILDRDGASASGILSFWYHVSDSPAADPVRTCVVSAHMGG